MESKLLAQFNIYMMITLILLSPIKSLSWDADDGSAPCSLRYLSKSYFEKHERLSDLDFEDYLAHTIPLCSCGALPRNVPKLSVLRRRLIGEGSHRHLSTFIKFHNQTVELPAHSCRAIIIEKLPSGVFADPFELQHLVHRGVFVDAGVFGDTNLELPSALSNRSVVEVHMDIKGLEINLDLPLHARYPPLDISRYSDVAMGIPDILVQCVKEEENCSSITRIEIGESADPRIEIGESADPSYNAAMWRIPCGNKAHSQLVSALTFMSAVFSALFIVLSALCYTPSFYVTNNSKQS